MTVEIKSSAGTYIKEFVNGDLGRTYPSMCDIIGNDCDIIQLDVEDIIVWIINIYIRYRKYK